VRQDRHRQSETSPFTRAAPTTARRRRRGLAPYAVLASALIGGHLLDDVALAQEVDQAVGTQEAADDAAAKSQKLVDTMADKKLDAAQRYRAALQRADSLEVYLEQLRRLVASQEKEMASLDRQIGTIEEFETGVLPLMVEMASTLRKLVEVDTPFLPDERLTRVEELESLIGRADVTAGEKFRRIMEAYLVEAEYGRNIEAYRGELVQEGKTRTVDFLRIGRTALYYQTLDGEETGRWDSAAGRWEVVEPSFRGAVRDGLKIARKQAPPELLKLPVDGPDA